LKKVSMISLALAVTCSFTVSGTREAGHGL
jgi:hypothetical protein